MPNVLRANARSLTTSNQQGLKQEAFSFGSFHHQIRMTQKNDRKGAADYQRFILDPIARLSDQWTAQPPTVKVHYVVCATALQEHENHARDSFKAGQIGKPSSLRGQAVETCRALIVYTSGAAQR